jgi:Prokaryotic E2 family E
MEAAVADVLPLPRRSFRLPQEDQAFLDRTGMRWEAVVQDGVCRLVLYDYPVPPGYDRDRVDLHLRIESGYPDVQIDMVYFYPALAKIGGGAINALTPEAFDGRTWQRWSRHRTSENPWRPGLDNVETHLALVAEWLAREVRK